MYMKFFTNIQEPRNGFKALFEIPKCRHEFKSQRGVISSDNYPNPGGYKPHSDCEYFFNYLSYQRVNLTFTDIDLPFNDDAFDYLTVANIYLINGNQTEDEIIRITGNTSLDRLSSIISNTGKVVVRFHTSKPSLDRKYRGFQFYFKRINGACARDLVDSSGEISMNNMPQYYCTWRITVPKGQRVKVVIDEITTLNQSRIVHMRFHEGFELNTMLASIDQSTADNIAPISSSDNQMLISIRQNSINPIEVKFIKIHWTSEEESLCPKHSDHDIEGSMSLKNISDAFRCVSDFRSDPNETLALKVDELTLVQRPGTMPRRFANPAYPDVSVRFGALILSTNVTSSEVFPVSGVVNRFSMVQLTTSNFKITSFKASFKRHPCGGTFMNLDTTNLVLGKIRDSMGSPDQSYGEIDCFWLVATSILNNITVTPKVQMTGNCDEEYMKIYNGNTVRSPILQTICGQNTTTGPLSLTGAVRVSIHYHAKNYQPEKSVEVVISKLFACGGEYKMPHPSVFHVYRLKMEKKDYSNNMECVWEVSTNAYFNLEVKFVNRFFIGE